MSQAHFPRQRRMLNKRLRKHAPRRHFGRAPTSDRADLQPNKGERQGRTKVNADRLIRKSASSERPGRLAAGSG